LCSTGGRLCCFAVSASFLFWISRMCTAFIDV
jgi:hypothetical protein